MKYTLLIILFYSCFSSKKQSVKASEFETIRIDLQEIETVKKGSVQIPLNLRIINAGSAHVYINDPSCWGSSVPVIIYNSNRISPIIKVKVDPECSKKLIYIGKEDTVSLKYSFPLEMLIDINKQGKYELKFVYSGYVFNADREKVSSIFKMTNKISFNVIN